MNTDVTQRKRKKRPPSKTVSFKKTEEDMLSYLAGKDFSYYVKGLIRADMEKHKLLTENSDKSTN
jgi:hypothetical protein